MMKTAGITSSAFIQQEVPTKYKRAPKKVDKKIEKDSDVGSFGLTYEGGPYMDFSGTKYKYVAAKSGGGSATFADGEGFSIAYQQFIALQLQVNAFLLKLGYFGRYQTFDYMKQGNPSEAIWYPDGYPSFSFNRNHIRFSADYIWTVGEKKNVDIFLGAAVSVGQDKMAWRNSRLPAGSFADSEGASADPEDASGAGMTAAVRVGVKHRPCSVFDYGLLLEGDWSRSWVTPNVFDTMRREMEGWKDQFGLSILGVVTLHLPNLVK